MITAYLQNLDRMISLTLTGNEASWQVVSITGLSPAPATINTAISPNLDGVRFNSSRLNARNIVITVKFNDAETARRTFENFFTPKSHVRFVYSAGDRSVSIDGYVDTFECDLFSASEIAQISIICPDPYFRAAETETQLQVQSAQHPSTTIPGTTPIKSGFVLNAVFGGDTFTDFELTNVVTGERIAIGYAFEGGDMLTIDTRAGHKTIKLIRGDAEINVFGYLSDDSTFFSIYTGAAALQYKLAESPLPPGRYTVTATVKYSAPYSGV